MEWRGLRWPRKVREGWWERGYRFLWYLSSSKVRIFLPLVASWGGSDGLELNSIRYFCKYYLESHWLEEISA